MIFRSTDAKPSALQTNWLLWAFIATIIYLLVAGWSIGFIKVWLFVSEKPELNNVGDFLAGVFAPLAFLWLVAAVLTQRQELKLTQEELEETRETLKSTQTENMRQTLLNHRAADANYQLALFDRRLQIYTRLQDTAYRFEDYDDIPKAQRDLFMDAMNSALHYFDEELVKKLGLIKRHVMKFARYRGIADALEERLSEGSPVSEQDEKALVGAHSIIKEETEWLYENMSGEVITELFKEPLNLPKKIMLPTDDEVVAMQTGSAR